MAFNANKELFRQIEFQGHPVLFTVLPIECETLPKGIERYEIRHSETGDDPIQIGRSIFVNHLGTLLVNEPLQLPPSGLMAVTADDFSYGKSPVVSLADYRKEYPPKENEVFEMVRGIALSEREWFYSDDQKDIACGYVAHFWGTVGENGITHTDFEHHPQRSEATQEIQSELAEVIGWLQSERGPLCSAESLKRFCSSNSRHGNLASAVYGFRIDTRRHVHYMRCLPERNAFEIRIYDRTMRQAFIKREVRKKFLPR